MDVAQQEQEVHRVRREADHLPLASTVVESAALGAMRSRALWYAGSAAVVLVLTAIGFPPSHLGIATALFVSGALVGEFLSIRLLSGLRLSFPLPFLAGLAVLNGPAVAMVADLLISFAAGTYERKRSGNRPDAWVLLNSSIGCICSGAAAVAFLAVSQLAPHVGALGAGLGYCLVYGLTNYGLVAQQLPTRIQALSLAHRLVREGLLPVALYVGVTLAVIELTHAGAAMLTPFALAPVVALHVSLRLKAREYEQYYETISALNMMLQRAHPYTHGHLERVARISEEVGLKLGLPPRRARLLREASVLHDIGKIAIDEAILDKPAKLTDEEFAHVRDHSAFGAMILAPVEPFREMVPWIRHHHERPDGRGYPMGLHDIEIPLESKIIAVVDAYDAMAGGTLPSERRPYREPMTPSEALAELRRCSGSQFDPQVVEAFADVLVGVGA